MQPDSLDRDFLAFRQSGDPAALAAVFDAAAPRLLLVAMHLCRDPATAEDLVQTVFLQALRDAGQFDARRPVLPWLLGLLEHRASDHRRRAHVRRERPVGAAGGAEAAAAGSSPERAAADREARDRVAEALAGMPRDYRDVLTLRLVHGLSAVEIAHAHGLPPATVRTRLRRGLDLLRGALPRGLVTPGLLALLGAEMLRASDGLTAVRAKVLAAAGGSAATSVAGFWLAIAAGVALAIGGWFAWPGRGEASAGPGAAGASPVAAVGGGGLVGDPGTRPRSPVGEPEPGLAREAVRDPRLTTVRGRVVAAATAQPLAGASVDVRGILDGARGDQPAGWRDPEAVVTGADGTFAFAFVPEPVLSIEVGVQAANRVTEWRLFAPLRQGVVLDVGDVALAPGTPVRLRLVDAGRPLPGLKVFIGREHDGGRPNGMDGRGPSDADGVVDLRVIAPGIWHFEVETNRLGGEGTVDVPLQAGVFEHVVELRPPAAEDSVSGVLVDGRGEPVAGVELGLRRGAGHAVATTEADGTFRWRGCAAAPPARIEFFGARPDLEWIDAGGEVRGGRHGLRLVVRRRAPATLRLEVHDAATGVPVESFAVAAWLDCWAAKKGGPDFKRGVQQPRPGGVAVLGDLAPGAYYASVFPPPPYAEQAELPVVLAEGRQTTLRVALPRPAELVVDVVDAATGASLSGIDVVLAKVVPAAHHAQVTRATYRVDLARARRGYGYSSATNVLELARGCSDDAGHVRLQAPPDTPALVLYAEGPRCTPTMQRDVALPAAGARVSLAVTPASLVRGVLGPVSFVHGFGPSPERLTGLAAAAATQLVERGEVEDDYPDVELRRVGGGAEARFTAPVAADGAFAVGGVPAGRYEVWVVACVPYDEGGGRNQNSFGPLATIDVPAVGAEPLRLDLSAHAPARANLRVFVDGQPWCSTVGLARLVDGTAVPVAFPVGDDGVGRSPALLPGTWVPFASVRDDDGNTRRIFATERFVLAPGATADLVAVLARRAVRVRVVDAAGAPVGALVTRLLAVDHPGFTANADRWRRTGDDGTLVFDPAPPGRLQLRAFSPAQLAQGDDREPALWLGEVAAVATAATFTLAK